jgi:hypothetical protein
VISVIGADRLIAAMAADRVDRDHFSVLEVVQAAPPSPIFLYHDPFKVNSWVNVLQIAIFVWF